jgi:hypothetical protein
VSAGTGSSVALEHLRGELLLLNLRLHRQLLRWRASHHHDATPDELLGLYVSDRDVDVLLDSLYAVAAPPGSEPSARAPLATVGALLADSTVRHRARERDALGGAAELPLRWVSDRLGLDEFERDVLLLALAPEVDRRYERVFAYLSDDATCRQPTVALALELLCDDLGERLRRRSAFGPGAPLVRLRAIRLGEEPGGLLAQTLWADPRVAAEVIGGEPSEPLLGGVARRVPAAHDPPPLAQAAEELELLKNRLRREDGAALAAIHGPDAHLAERVATHLASAAGRQGLLLLDGEALARLPARDEVVACALREALITGAALAVRGGEALAAEPAMSQALERLIQPSDGVPRFAISAARHPAVTAAGMLELSLPGLDATERRRLWREALDGSADEDGLAELADRFRLTSGQIRTAARRSLERAAARQEPGGPTPADLFASCRECSTGALGTLAPHGASIHDWDDLVLPGPIKAQLQGIERWVRFRPLVYDDWGFARRAMLGRGLSVLFSGPSGTGKTMAAGILARSLGLELFKVDLATVVSKYIGETEKNLSRVFDAAERSCGVLLFDEADALFGKRSEIKDAHDRYANIEVSYLLQRMEAYDGVAILATNFRQNLDQAFARRLHVTVEFPFPQAGDRERIWRRMLAGDTPLAPDADLGLLSRRFSLAGGAIRNCALTAAFEAAAEREPIGMRHLAQAIARELAKLDQPIVRRDFGPWYDAIRGDVRVRETVR